MASYAALGIEFIAWILALRSASDGSRVRAWLVTLAVVFAAGGLLLETTWPQRITIGALNSLLAPSFVGLFSRTEGIFLSLVVVVLGTAVLFAGVPFVADSLFPAAL